MHETLMAGVRGQDKRPGEFRNTQNWIGLKGCKIEEAIYVPPPPTALNDVLDNFIEYVNIADDQIDPIIQTSLVHAQFEMIHPFDDGNGRIGRLLIPLFLMKKGCLVSPSLYISGYLEAHRDDYYRCLGQINTDGDWIGWIRFFLKALINQSNSNLDLVRQIIELYDQTKNEITENLHTDQAIHILDMLFDTPVFLATDLYKRLNIQRQRAALYIRWLKECGIVREVRPARGRRAALLSFDRLWKISDQQ